MNKRCWKSLFPAGTLTLPWSTQPPGPVCRRALSSPAHPSLLPWQQVPGAVPTWAVGPVAGAGLGGGAGVPAAPGALLAAAATGDAARGPGAPLALTIHVICSQGKCQEGNEETKLLLPKNYCVVVFIKQAKHEWNPDVSTWSSGGVPGVSLLLKWFSHLVLLREMHATLFEKIFPFSFDLLAAEDPQLQSSVMN